MVILGPISTLHSVCRAEFQNGGHIDRNFYHVTKAVYSEGTIQRPDFAHFYKNTFPVILLKGQSHEKVGQIVQWAVSLGHN
jgi:hypothetical protein